MTMQRPDVPGAPSRSDPDPALEAEVLRRATQLCLQAEPHTDQSPCSDHVTEANRQLLGLLD